MYVPLCVFKKRLPRIQNYVTDAKYYKKNNMNGERKQFVEFFSLQNWAKLSKTAKQGHSITDCRACTYDLHSMSSLHLSYSRELKDAINKCQDMTESFLKLHWYKNNDRCNQHCQGNGEHYETHI